MTSQFFVAAWNHVRHHNIPNKPPPGGRTRPPTSAHPSVGLRGLRPCVFPTPTSGARPLQAMPAASWSRLWRSLRPCGREYRLIRARRWPPRGWVRRAPRRGLVGCYGCGNAMAKHWARVARRRDCAAFGYVVNRATSDRVQPLRFFILVGSRGVPPLAVQAMAGRAKPSRGSGGATPCRGATIGCGRDAGISGSRAAALAVGDPPRSGRRLAFFAERKKCHTELSQI